MQFAIWIIGIVVGLFALDRLFLWFEEKGWLYWRKVKPKCAAGDFFIGLDSIGNPNAAHAEEARKTVLEEEDDGDDDGARNPDDRVA